jgi:hypothetical protein
VGHHGAVAEAAACAGGSRCGYTCVAPPRRRLHSTACRPSRGCFLHDHTASRHTVLSGACSPHLSPHVDAALAIDIGVDRVALRGRPPHTRGGAHALAAGTRRHPRLLFSTALCQGAHAAAGASQSVAALTAPGGRLCLKSPRPYQLPPPKPFQWRPQFARHLPFDASARSTSSSGSAHGCSPEHPGCTLPLRAPLTAGPAAARAQDSRRALAAGGAFGRARAYAEQSCSARTRAQR